MRDQRKDEQYFNTYIETHTKYLNEFLEMYEQYQVEKPHIASQMISYITGYMINVINAKYSIGADIQEVKELMKKYLFYLDLGEVENYEVYINALAMIILCDEDPTTLTHLMNNECYQDALSTYFMNMINHEEVKECHTLIKNKPNEGYLDYAYSHDLYTFLDFMNNHWYIQCYESYWFNNHKSKNDNVYNGYYSYVAAALLKLNHIDPNTIQCQYIPVDLI